MADILKEIRGQHSFNSENFERFSAHAEFKIPFTLNNTTLNYVDKIGGKLEFVEVKTLINIL